MKWFEQEKLIKEIKEYLEDNILYANKNVKKITYAYRFDQGLKEILEKYLPSSGVYQDGRGALHGSIKT